MKKLSILILTVTHGEAHRQMAKAVRKTLLHAAPTVTVKVVDGLKPCAAWFRLYYNSYLIPLRYWPSLWRWIENIQHRSTSTGPGWLYRRGSRPLRQFLRAFNPDVVVTTEVGLCELAALFKHENDLDYRLVGLVTGKDADRAWAQPDVDLFAVAPEVVADLEAAGVPATKILACGMPIDPAFACLPERQLIRTRLALQPEVPLLLVLFGGRGFGKPQRILKELRKVETPMQVVFITGKSHALADDLRHHCQDQPGYTVLEWVDNMHEWMTAADLLLGKPGGGTITEALACSLPLLAFAPLPGSEERTCTWIEDSGVGRWIRRPEDLAPTVQRLLNDPAGLQRLRANARAKAHPRAAFEAAEAILKLVQPGASGTTQ